MHPLWRLCTTVVMQLAGQPGVCSGLVEGQWGFASECSGCPQLQL